MSKKVHLTKELEDFLRKEKVLARFKRNVKDTNTKKLPIDSTLGGFRWAKSPEGIKFWIDIDDKFLNQ